MRKVYTKPVVCFFLLLLRLQFEHSHDTASPVSRLEQQVGEVEGELEGLEERAVGVKAVMEAAQEAVEALNKEKNGTVATVG